MRIAHAKAQRRFAPITAPANPDGYSVQARGPLAPTIKARLAYMADFLRQGAARGNARLHAIGAGHLAIYLADHPRLEQHVPQCRAALGDA